MSTIEVWLRWFHMLWVLGVLASLFAGYGASIWSQHVGSLAQRRLLWRLSASADLWLVMWLLLLALSGLLLVFSGCSSLRSPHCFVVMCALLLAMVLLAVLRRLKHRPIRGWRYTVMHLIYLAMIAAMLLSVFHAQLNWVTRLEWSSMAGMHVVLTGLGLACAVFSSVVFVVTFHEDDGHAIARVAKSWLLINGLIVMPLLLLQIVPALRWLLAADLRLTVSLSIAVMLQMVVVGSWLAAGVYMAQVFRRPERLQMYQRWCQSTLLGALSLLLLLYCMVQNRLM